MDQPYLLMYLKNVVVFSIGNPHLAEDLNVLFLGLEIMSISIKNPDLSKIQSSILGALIFSEIK